VKDKTKNKTRSVRELMASGLREDELKKTAQELREERERLIDEGLHFLSEGIRLFLSAHPKMTAKKKTAWVARLGKLDADIRELVREKDNE
jgi:hypothetical protein